MEATSDSNRLLPGYIQSDSPSARHGVYFIGLINTPAIFENIDSNKLESPGICMILELNGDTMNIPIIQNATNDTPRGDHAMSRSQFSSHRIIGPLYFTVLTVVGFIAALVLIIYGSKVKSSSAIIAGIACVIPAMIAWIYIKRARQLTR